MKNSFLILSFLGLVLINSCSNPVETGSSDNDTTEVVKANPVDSVNPAAISKGGIIVTPFSGSPDFPDAVLEMNAPSDNAKLKSGDVNFIYEVKNFTLGSQTPDAQNKHCSNSAKGQHIHLILNNEPYIAHYETNFTEKLKDGHYVSLSFLSRSYHESLKHFEAFDLRQFTVGNAESKKADLTKPFLFYSRPKGEYIGDDTKKILLDFYLVNTNLSDTANKVKANINGNEFILSKWQPYTLEGLPMGENTIKLELVDKDGKFIEGPFNRVERKITLK
jgi:hypothetical protein